MIDTERCALITKLFERVLQPRTATAVGFPPCAPAQGELTATVAMP